MSCWAGPVAWLPPFAPSFLRDNNAVYAGTTITPEHGACTMWRVFLPAMGNFLLTVYFEQVYGRFVRYDFQTWGGDQLNVGVTTLLFNVVTGTQRDARGAVRYPPMLTRASAGQATRR